MNSLKKLILFFIALELVFSGVLAYSAYYKTSICLPGFDCDYVQNSAYGSLFGIKLSTLGIFAFAALLIVFLLSLQYKKLEYLFLTANVIGAIGSLSFLYIQLIILKKFCSSCLAIDLLMLILAGFSIYEFQQAHKYATP